jgi:hypothetical protein
MGSSGRKIAIPVSSRNSRRAAIAASSPSFISPFGIDHAPLSLLRQNGPPGCTSKTSSLGPACRYIRIPALEPDRRGDFLSGNCASRNFLAATSWKPQLLRLGLYRGALREGRQKNA